MNSTSTVLDDRPAEADGTPREVTGSVRFESMQYMAEVPESPDLTRSQFLSARLSALGSFDVLPSVSYLGDFSAGTFFRRSQSDIVVSEAALAMNLGKAWTVSVGRKKADWSEMDSRWQLGLWQPRYALDTLRPEEQGLTGLFAEWKGAKFKLLTYATPIFIPTMGPDVREDGGDLKSDSRWWRQPSSQLDFNDRINSINYKLDIPDRAKLVGNPGAGARARLGEERGPWVAAAGGYKPMNDLIYRRQNFKSATESRVDVTIEPDVAYHHITSMDLGYAGEAFSVSASALHDRPENKQADTDSSIQKILPLQAYSAQVDLTIRDFFSRSVQVQGGYLRVYGGGIVDIVQDGSEDDFTMFDSRLKFTNAASVALQGEVARIARRPLVTKLKYLHDWDQAGNLVNAEFQYSPGRDWALIAGADVLGVSDENKKPSGFLNQYRANDRVYGGMTYVF